MALIKAVQGPPGPPGPPGSTGTGGATILNVSGDQNVELTKAQYSVGIIRFTGVLTGNIQVIFPSPPQFWAVSNETTGNFTLTLITELGTGIELGAGSAGLVFSDGTNIRKLENFMQVSTVQLAGSVTVSGAVNNPVTNYSGQQTFQVSITGSGAVSATVAIEGSNDNVHWLGPSTSTDPVGVVTLSGSGSAVAGFANSGTWAYFRAYIVAISGTNAAVTAVMGMLT